MPRRRPYRDLVADSLYLIQKMRIDQIILLRFLGPWVVTPGRWRDLVKKKK
jgi:hypothetical protein